MKGGSELPASAKPRCTLLAVLRRAHLNAALIAMLTFTLPLSLVSVVALRGYIRHNQALVVRTMAYTLEAQEELEGVARKESLAYARLQLASGIVLAEYRQSNQGATGQFEGYVTRWLLPNADEARIEHEGNLVGTVTARSSSAGLARILYVALAALAANVIVVVLTMVWLGRRVRRDILVPLSALAAVTHAGRDGGPGLRAPPAELAELHSLGEDFNSLLDQVDDYQAKLMSENKSLTKMALHDCLTGLPNRSYFFDRLNAALAGAKVDGTGLAVLYLDCDYFKEVNDTYGHAAGDALLIDLARRIKAGLRESDVMARLGGDEFVVLLMHARNVRDAQAVVQNAQAIAQKLRNNLAEPLPLPDGRLLHHSVSIGIAVYPPLGGCNGQGQGTGPDVDVDANLLVEQADCAMYQAKTTARGTVCVYGADSDFLEAGVSHGEWFGPQCRQ
jgi:diguanylate cyclase (GGDEF)-like protein